MNYALHLLIYFNMFAVVAMGLNMVVGYCGLLTLAQAGYYAVGAYVYALVTMKLGWGFIPAAAMGAGVAALLSLAVSLPSWRLRGDFFVMATLAVQALLFSALYNWTSTESPAGTWSNLTNGPFGLPGISKPVIFGYKFATLGGVVAVSTVTALICIGITWMLLRSPWGRVLKAMRDDELAARGLGKNVRLLKVQSFAISCALAAVGGSIYASYVSYVDPSLASLDQSILLLCMVIVGGVGNVRGPLVGAAVLLAIPEILRFVHIPDSIAADIRLMAYGLLLILMTHFRPQGLAGEYRFE